MAEMTDERYFLIERQELMDKFDDDDVFILWNVAPEKGYRTDANIPGSEWVPADEVRETVRRQKLAKNKEIITYGANAASPASRDAARCLVAMGFKKVSAYEGGFEEWGAAGLPLVAL